MFMDGVIETNTAFMLAPYVNAPRRPARRTTRREDYNRIVAMIDRRGWQIMVHGLGDGAVRMVLDGFERAAAVNPAAGARTPSPGRAHRDDRSRRRAALRQARRHRVDASGRRLLRSAADTAVPASCRLEPGRGRRLGRQHRARARRARRHVEEHFARPAAASSSDRTGRWPRSMRSAASSASATARRAPAAPTSGCR